ncbi:MAG TPA: hypothetical protein VKW08_19055 [Xanthobacteraceae bacterium]|jgi:hypothetical protein|nr:hypothetical protein [Xanthobacteraceae bacterium]
MAPSFDHFTPLSRAVASIDRDAYAERFAIYDRAYKALLRRLATAQPPLSAADLTREEKAFHEAVGRVEFGAEDAPTLVPQDEPVDEASPARLRELVAGAAVPGERASPRLRAPREPGADARQDDESTAVAAVLLEDHSPRRSLTRRVGERMGLAVLLLAFLGVMQLIDSKPEPAVTASAAPAADASDASDTPATQDTSAAPAAVDMQRFGAGAVNNPIPGLPRLPYPSWIAPQMFYTVPPIPTVAQNPAPQQSAPPSAQTGAAQPHGEIPLPTPRPEI